jgi:hypothetical protein
MNSGTGAIARFELRSDARLAGYDIELTPDQLRDVEPMSRRERRAWAAKRRAEAKADAPRRRFKTRPKRSR